MLESRLSKLLAVLAMMTSLQGVWSAKKFEVESADGDVLVLDESNFDTTIAEHESGILVEFYAPWCGHCKKLAPEYKKAATKLLEDSGGKVRLAMVDATEDKDLAERYNVKGFPSLKFFSGGDPAQHPVEYEGGRTERDIIAYMQKKTGEAATLVVDEEDFKRKLKNVRGPEILVGGFFSDLEGPAARQFLAAAAKVDDVEFVYALDSTFAEVWPDQAARSQNNDNDDSSAAAHGGPQAVEPNCLVVFKGFDEQRAVLPITATMTADDLAAFVVSRSTPLVIDFTQERTKQLFRGPVKVHVLTFVDPKGAYVPALRKTLEGLAAERRGQVLHVVVPSNEDKVASYFGVDKKDFPLSVLADVSTEGSMKKYPFSGSKAHVAGELKAFVADFFSGDLQPTLKSEDDKPSNLRGKVKVVTGSTFNEAVLESGKDVFLEFYAPWCGHCKALAPKWDELGERFSKVSEEPVWIAKMDATANEIDHPSVVVKGFPAIFFFPDGGQPVRYDGGRETEDFVDFLVQHATKPFELEDGTKGKAHDEL